MRCRARQQHGYGATTAQHIASCPTRHLISNPGLSVSSLQFSTVFLPPLAFPSEKACIGVHASRSPHAYYVESNLPHTTHHLHVRWAALKPDFVPVRGVRHLSDGIIDTTRSKTSRVSCLFVHLSASRVYPPSICRPLHARYTARCLFCYGSVKQQTAASLICRALGRQ